MQTSEVLYAAADLIERNGWWTDGGEVNGTIPLCAGNAIYRVYTDGQCSLACLYSAQRALYTHVGGTDLCDIWHWNDAPGRTASEVIEVLRAAAVIEEAKENAPHVDRLVAEIRGAGERMGVGS